MVKNINSKKQHPTLLEYLKKEKPEYYQRFRQHYSEKKAVFPALTEQQYLLHVVQKTGKRTKTRLEEADGSLIDNGEIAKLEKIINSSPILKKIVNSYRGIRNSGYVTRKEKKELDEQAANRVYENMGEEDKKKYNPKRITIIMPKLNLGPWKKPAGSGLGEDVNNFIRETRDLFKNDEEFLKRLLERCYGEKLKSKKTMAEARGVLNTLN